MAKVKVIGDVNFEFDVKFNQNEDIEIEAKAIDIDGKKLYIGTGNIEKINPKAFGFITNRIEYFIKKNNGYTDLPVDRRDEERAIKKVIEKGFGFLFDAMYGNKEAAKEMLDKKLFLLTEFGMRFYLKKFYENKQK
jgi:hypothetical protein